MFWWRNNAAACRLAALLLLSWAELHPDPFTTAWATSALQAEHVHL